MLTAYKLAGTCTVCMYSKLLYTKIWGAAAAVEFLGDVPLSLVFG